MRLSVIIPVYNVEKYIDQCLESAIPLIKDKDIEIIVVDDGSTDNSRKIVDEQAKIYPLKVIHQPNGGLSAARNRGLSIAQGEYISFVDSDDYIDSGQLIKLLNIAEKEQADIIVGDYFDFRDDTESISGINTIAVKETSSFNGLKFLLSYYKPLRSVVWRNLYRTSFLKSNSLLFHEGVNFEDVEFTPIVFSKAQKVIYSAISFYYYRQRTNSITTSHCNEKKLYDVLKVWEKLTKESYRLNDDSASRLFRELGFHAFLNQYSLYDDQVSPLMLTKAKRLGNERLKTLKYKIISILFRNLPDKTFLKLIKI